MSHDALFQLGMGSVELDATQTEEPFMKRGLRACAGVVRAVRPSGFIGRAACAAAGLLHAGTKERGNRAEARPSRAGIVAQPFGA